MAIRVFTRDGGCVPAKLGAPDECQGRLEIMHIRAENRAGTKRPPSDDEFGLAAGCGWHHGTKRTGGGWATSKHGMDVLRAYLRGVRQREDALLIDHVFFPNREELA